MLLSDGLITASSDAQVEPFFASSQEVIAEMRRVAEPGQTDLDTETLESLRALTGKLVDLQADEGVEHYHRYIATENRELETPDDLLHEQLSGKTILVTGGTGLIGTELMSRIQAYGPARLVSISRGLTKPHGIVEGAEYRHLDIRDEAAVTDVMEDVQPDIVYHLAAEKHPGIAEVEPQRTLATNIFGTQNIVRAAQDAGVQQMVYASTGKSSRYFSPDTYAASKKAAEAVVAEAAQEGEMVCSGVRFTHVVDGSNIITRIHNWIEADQAEDATEPTEPIRLHSPETLFYIQSAKESAALLLLSGLDARPGTFRLDAIRMLDMPIQLGHLAVGALAEHNASTPIYVSGHDSGYEAQPYDFLYDPMLSGETSPLLNAIEAPETEQSEHNEKVDVFPFSIQADEAVRAAYQELAELCADPDVSLEALHAAKDKLSWVLLDARLQSLPLSSIARTAKRIERAIAYHAEHTPDEPELEEHALTSEAILKAHAAKVA